MTMPCELLLGIDIGGTQIKLGLCDQAGRIQVSGEAPTPQASGGGLTATVLAEVIRAFLAKQGLLPRDFARVGLGVPGIVQGGKVWAPNLGWQGLELAGLLAEDLGVVPLLENDANAAAWGEYRAGAGRGVPDLVLLTLGTGVGCGIVSRGALLRGANGQAGEIGHITVVVDGPLCTCGKRGCLETRAGTYALMRMAGFEGEPDVRLVFEAAARGEERAVQALSTFSTYLGVALSTIVNLHDPSLILIGGGIARAGRPLFDALESALAAQLGHQIRVRPQLRPTLLGNDAGIVGAALLTQVTGAEQRS
jgi:glucokinase